MEGPRGARTEEFDQVMALINNVFRIKRGCEPTMALEFPLLLHENNVHNMHILKDGEKVIATVNYMTDTIYIEGVPVSYGAIGAVCTEECYEKRGYSSAILDDVESHMSNEVSMCLISGTRTLYTRRQALRLMAFNRYDIEPRHLTLDFELHDYQLEDLREMHRLYQENKTRYKRSYDAFKTLINSGTYPWGKFSYVRSVIKNDGRILGYVILRIIQKEDENIGEIVEVSGESEVVLSAIQQMTYDHHLAYTSYYVHMKDALYDMDHERDYQQGVIKIMHYQRLIKELEPYFQRFLDSGRIRGIDNRYGLTLGQEVVYCGDLETVTKLLFDINGMREVDFSLAPKLKAVLDQALPLPMPWTKNLNYQ